MKHSVSSPPLPKPIITSGLPWTQGRIAEAIRHYTVALRLHPRYVEVHFNLDVTLARQGRFIEARQQMSDILRLDSTHAAFSA